MKMFRPIALLLAVCLCTGCFDVTEEYWFNKDRSGRYEMSMDMASMGAMMSMMQKIVPQTDSLGKGPDMPRDTMILLSTLPDSVKTRLPYPALADQTSLSIKMQGAFKITFAFNFQEINQIGQFWENLSAMDTVARNNDYAALSGLKSMLNNMQTKVQWEGKTLQLQTVPVVIPAAADNPFGGFGMDNPMVKMMFGSNKYRQKFHFASKVRSAKGTDVQHDGKEAWATYPLADVLGDPTILSCSIKVKK